MVRSSIASAPFAPRARRLVRASWCLVALFAGCAADHAPGSVAQGDACDYSIDCAPVKGGVVQCSCSTDGSGPVCGASYPLTVGCGADNLTCTDSETCAFDDAHPNGACLPSAPLGQSCELVNCLSGLFCDDAQVCEAARAVGEPCDTDDQTSCAAPAFCDLMTAKCSALRLLGDPCDSAQLDWPECIAPAACNGSNLCVTPQPNGASCTDDYGCLSFFCSGGTCETQPCGGGGTFGDGD